MIIDWTQVLTTTGIAFAGATVIAGLFEFLNNLIHNKTLNNLCMYLVQNHKDELLQEIAKAVGGRIVEVGKE